MNAAEARHYLLSMELKTEEPIDYKQYPFHLPAVKSLKDPLIFHPGVTYIVGENGSGKSTLLEALAVSLRFNPEGGSHNFHFSTRASHSVLNAHLRIARSIHRPKTGYFLRAESFYNVATEIENLDSQPSFGPPIIDSYGGKSLHEQSHGESYFALMLNRFGSEGLYLLDEPESALSPKRQMAVLSLMHQLIQQNCQFIIATHSPILLSYPQAFIYELREKGLELTPYEETDTYQTSHYFLNHYQEMLKILLDEETSQDT